MSTDLSKFDPLPPMPKINILPPGNITSKKFDSFPPIKTPKLQELNKEKITYPVLKTINYKKLFPIVPKKKVITKIIKSIKTVSKLDNSEIPVFKRCKKIQYRNRYIYVMLILIKSLILCTVIYYILSSIIKE